MLDDEPDDFPENILKSPIKYHVSFYPSSILCFDEKKPGARPNSGHAPWVVATTSPSSRCHATPSADGAWDCVGWSWRPGHHGPMPPTNAILRSLICSREQNRRGSTAHKPLQIRSWTDSSGTSAGPPTSSST